MMKSPMLYIVSASLALLMAGCVTQGKYDDSQQQNAALQQQYQELQTAMGSEINSKDMQITRMQDAIKLSVNSQLLFPSGGWEMSPEAETTIAKIAKVMAPHQMSKINVNGYTDTTPIGPGLAAQGVTSNDILSQKRADDVMQYMISQGVKPDMVSAHGFGEANPVASNDTADGKAQNRRVELTIEAPAQ